MQSVLHRMTLGCLKGGGVLNINLRSIESEGRGEGGGDTLTRLGKQGYHSPITKLSSP